MQQKDVQICDLLKNKDAKGMEFLFEEYYKPLVVWGDTFLNDVSRSEDLVQDFLIKLWEKRIGEKLEPSTLRSYLFVSIRFSTRLIRKEGLSGTSPNPFSTVPHKPE